MKKNLGWSYTEDFFVPEEVKQAAAERQKQYDKTEADWNAMVSEYRAKFPDMAHLWDTCYGKIDIAKLSDKAFYELTEQWLQETLPASY